jgi:DNA-binding CsgD family transcriptional regulator
MGLRNTSSTDSEKSSLRLLEAIVEVGSHPERFDDMCDDWAKNSDDAKNLKSFNTLLNVVYSQSLSKIDAFNANQHFTHQDMQNDTDPTSFLINSKLEIISIGQRASEILDMSLGDNVSDHLNVEFNAILNVAKSNAQKKILGDIYGKDGSRHIASIARVSLRGHIDDIYRFTLWKIELPTASETYIRDTLGLTNAEIEILELALERLSVQSISDIRNCTLNTTRKHINNIKKKFKSSSLTDVVSSAHEIIALHYEKRLPVSQAREWHLPIQRNSNISNLPIDSKRVEFSRYGALNAKPLMVLHSLEYGVAPPRAFIEEANRAGYCVYLPMRAGFGRTSNAESTRLSASLLNEFISILGLKDIKLVALSTAAPTAIHLIERCDRIESAIFVNYGFDTKDKIDNIKPDWLRGLLKFGVGSDAGYRFAFHMTKRMLRMIGYKNFYRRIYQGCKEDLDFLEDNLDIFKASANLILSAKPEAVREDLTASFIDNPTLDPALLKNFDVISIFGEHTHGISLGPMKLATEKLGIPFYAISNTGRNCIYQNPMSFFQIIGTEDAATEKDCA